MPNHGYSEKRPDSTLVNPPVQDVENLASAYDCTGLIPSQVLNDEEAESYARLYAIHMQKPTEPGEESPFR